MSFISFIMAKLGLMAPAIVSQTVVRTRDAVDDLSVFIESSFKAHLIKQSSFFAATDWAHLPKGHPLISPRKSNLAFFQWNRRSLCSMTARGGTDEPLLSLIRSRISLFFIKFNRGWFFGTKKLRLRTSTGRSPQFCLSWVAKPSSVLLLFMLLTVAPVPVMAAWIYVPDAFMANPSGKLRFYDALGVRKQIFFTPAQVLAGGFVVDPLLMTASNLNIATPFPVLPPAMLSAAAAQVGVVVPPVVGGGFVPTLYPDPLNLLNPVNAVSIGKDFAQYSSYMLGVAVLGLFLGMSFGGILGLIRKNVKVI